MGVDLLHPAIQRHLWTSLRWFGLWPLQARAVEPVLDGEDVLLVSGPGWGRVEAAFLPLVSRMLSEAWEGTSVLFLGRDPERLEWILERFELLGDCVGRTAALQILPASAVAADVLLLETCPETGLPREAVGLPDTLRALVVDEVESFVLGEGSAPRLQALARLEASSVHPVQRIGLCGPRADADRLLGAFSPRGRAAVVVRGPH